MIRRINAKVRIDGDLPNSLLLEYYDRWKLEDGNRDGYKLNCNVQLTEYKLRFYLKALYTVVDTNLIDSLSQNGIILLRRFSTKIVKPIYWLIV